MRVQSVNEKIPIFYKQIAAAYISLYLHPEKAKTAEGQAQQEDQQRDGADSVANATEDTFKRWVKDYRAVDKEIRQSAPALAALRKRKKQLDEVILLWMQQNSVPRVQLREDEFLERNIKTSVQPLNSGHISQTLAEFFGGDELKASEVTTHLYESRPETEMEILKVTKATAASKKRKVRPVDE